MLSKLNINPRQCGKCGGVIADAATTICGTCGTEYHENYHMLTALQNAITKIHQVSVSMPQLMVSVAECEKYLEESPGFDGETLQEWSYAIGEAEEIIDALAGKTSVAEVIAALEEIIHIPELGG